MSAYNSDPVLSPIAQAALAVALTGLPVFPCAHDKRPIVEGAYKAATADPLAVAEAFSRPGAALIGVPTGKLTGLVAVDVDVGGDGPDSENSGMRWLDENRHRLPATRTHRSGRGGLHLLFREPEGVELRNSQWRLGKHVDVRANGGSLIWPGSPGYSIADQAEPAEMPAWLIEACRKPEPPPPAPYIPRTSDNEGDTPYGLAALKGQIEAIRTAPFGRQEAVLNESGLKIGGLVAGRELEADLALAELLAAGRSIGSQPGREPWAAGEVEAKLRRAFATGQTNGRSAPTRPRLATVDGYLASVEADADSRHPRWEPSLPTPPGEAADEPALEPPVDLERSQVGIFPKPVDPPADADRIRTVTSAAALLRLELPTPERLLGSLVTRTSRTFLVGPTGIGKTLFGLALAGGIASGTGFLHWRTSRPARVLYVDGEMSLVTLQARVRDLQRRLGGSNTLDLLHRLSWQDAGELGLGELQPLNTDQGKALILRLCDMIQPEVVMLDNVQALLTGDLKDEVTWNATWPLVAALTRRNIGQVWFDHTGHDTSRQYGSSTKAWKFDTVGILTALADENRAAGETGFTLSFEAPGKARNRDPGTWDDYATTTIRLRDDEWTGGDAGGTRGTLRPKLSTMPFYDALAQAIGRDMECPPGETTEAAWEAACIQRGILEPRGSMPESARRLPLRRAKSALITVGWIAVEGDRVLDIHKPWA